VSAFTQPTWEHQSPDGVLNGGGGEWRAGGCGRVGAPEIAVTASRISQEGAAAISSQASDCGIQTDIGDAYVEVCARAVPPEAPAVFAFSLEYSVFRSEEFS